MIISCNSCVYDRDHPEMMDCLVQNQSIPQDLQVFKIRNKEGIEIDAKKILTFISDNCSMLMIPRCFGDMEMLQNLNIRNSNLETISKLDLKNFSNLKLLNLYGNHLEYLPGDLFEFTRNIEYINFSDNKIKFIGPKLLEGLTKLEKICFRENINIDCGTHKKTFFTQIDDIIRTKCMPPSDDTEMFQILLRQQRPEPKKENLQVENSRNFLIEVQNYLTIDEFKDFTIKVGSREFKVHKFIFMARSETFAELIKNNPDAEDLVLQDISVEVFESILSFIYNDQIPVTQNIIEVFAAAGRLKIRGLMIISADKLINSMEEEKNLEILFKILSFANKFEHEELRLKAFEEIKKHFPGTTLKDDLARQPEKLRKIIKIKLMLEREFEDLEIEKDNEEEEAVGGMS